MKCSSLLLFTFERLKIVQTTLASNLTLKLFELVEGQASGVRSTNNENDVYG